MILMLLACAKTTPPPADSRAPAALSLSAEVLELPLTDLRTASGSGATLILSNTGESPAEDLSLRWDAQSGAAWTAALDGEGPLAPGDQRIIGIQADFSTYGDATAQLSVVSGAASATAILLASAHAPAASLFGRAEGGGECALRWEGRVVNTGDRALAVFGVEAALGAEALTVASPEANIALEPGEFALISVEMPHDIPALATLTLTLHTDDPAQPTLVHQEPLDEQSVGFTETFVSPGDAVRLVVVHEVNGGARFLTTFEALTDHLDDVARAFLASPLDLDLRVPSSATEFMAINAGDAATLEAELRAWSTSSYQPDEDLTRLLSDALDAEPGLFAGAPSVAVALITDMDIAEPSRGSAEVLTHWESKLDPGARLTVHGMSRAPGDACGPGESEFIPDLIEATGGLFMSECMRDWPAFYADLLDHQSLLHRSMDLGSAPDPDSLELWVDGVSQRADAWSLEGSSLRIADSVPLRPGAELRVHYTAEGCL